jgi:hypothetical protein
VIQIDDRLSMNTQKYLRSSCPLISVKVVCLFLPSDHRRLLEQVGEAETSTVCARLLEVGDRRYHFFDNNLPLQ